MKKKKLSGLKLNKKTISNLNTTQLKGGLVGNDGQANLARLPGITVGAGCTRPTIDLSYCPGIGIPNPCLSNQVCA